MSRKPKTPRVLLEPVAGLLRERLFRRYERVEVCGSLRRGQAWIGDIDLVCAGPRPDAPDLDGLLAAVGASYEDDGNKGPRRPYRIERDGGTVFFDVWEVPLEQFGAATLYATGDGPFNVIMRKWALFKGLRLYLTGVYDREDHNLAGATEEDVFRALGWEFVSPEERQFPACRRHTRQYSLIMNEAEASHGRAEPA